MKRALILAVRLYRTLLSPLKPRCCRYVPTCSEYALEALAIHGAAKGSWLSARRVCRCHPWGGHGWDPVPPGASAGATGERARPISGAASR